MPFDYDFVVVGSGFGGSVSALRLSEKGYRVAVLEAGRRFRPEDFAKTSWDLPRFLWVPALGCYGIQRITLLDDVLALNGAGVGGGSLVYGNTLLVPPEPFFRDPQWAGLDPDWQQTLKPFYDLAKRMLGVATNPKLWRADDALRDYAVEIGRSHLFKPTEVGVFFGDPDTFVPDPFFGGDGPPRRGCDHKGHCMVGCEHGGKNSLDRNYLFLAERKGAQIFPDTTVTDIAPLGGGGYRVTSKRTSGFLAHPRREWTAAGVVLAASALGTNRLLLQCRERGSLPGLSPRLGHTVRTNSEVINGVSTHGGDYAFSDGIAITSSLFVDDVTHVEPVRYPAGSDFMWALTTMMVDGGGAIPRWLGLLIAIVTHPIQWLRNALPFGWARNGVICLVMQTLDNFIQLKLKRHWWWPFSKTLGSSPSSGRAPTYIPSGQAAARALAKRLNGDPRNAINEVLLDRPMTAHLLGGCPIGADAEHGVIDKHHRVFGYDNMFVVDGAAMPANLGVNPSLTITALAEHAMSHVPPKS